MSRPGRPLDRVRQTASVLGWALAPVKMRARFERRHPEAAASLETRPDLLLIHIPKTGGLSAVKAIYDAEDSNHWTWAQWRSRNPPEFRERLKLAIVRDPVARFLSAYDYLARGGRNDWDRRLRDRFIAPYDGPEAVIERLQDRGYLKKVVHFWPQRQFVCAGRRVMVNRLIPFRRMTTELPVLVGAELPEVNATPGAGSAARSGEERLSTPSLEALKTFYAGDFALHRLALNDSSDVYGVRLSA